MHGSMVDSGRVVIVAGEGSSIARGRVEGGGEQVWLHYSAMDSLGGLLSRRDHPQRIWTIYSWSNLPRNTRMLLYTSSIYDISTTLHACTSKEPSIHYEKVLASQLGYVNNSTHGSVSTTHSKYIALKYNIY